MTPDAQITAIENSFRDIMVALGLDIHDDSLTRTPHRFAKMLVNEVFDGLDRRRFPEITTQDNKFGYSEPLCEANISIISTCEHHFVPIIGRCHIAYIPAGRLIGLSKLNRIARHLARRPQVQERLTIQIAETLAELVETDDVAVTVDAEHLCVKMRGIEDVNAVTRTTELKGAFQQSDVRKEYFAAIPRLSDLKSI
ncbi:GTP cyclohydrolase I FolE [Mycobacterium koreense]|nr:GTP cyclohydrolase I FolE [Mycolicibacillus koreensis]